MKLTAKQKRQVLESARRALWQDNSGNANVQAIARHMFHSSAPSIRRAISKLLDDNGIDRIRAKRSKLNSKAFKPEKVATLAETPMSLSPPFEGPELDVVYVIADYELEKELAKLAKKGNAKAYAILMELIQA